MNLRKWSALRFNYVCAIYFDYLFSTFSNEIEMLLIEFNAD